MIRMTPPYLNPSSATQFSSSKLSSFNTKRAISKVQRQPAMKNLFLSMLFLLSFLFFIANLGEAAVPCPTVDAKAAACVGFATGKDPKPSAACCSGLQQLAHTVKSVDDKKAICRCLKAGAKSLGIQDRFLSKIPAACNIKVGFPVSINTNCETIH